eukprot:CAMPEP_0197621132 /NCGR_PEP_ID=MMETSP1338-20131121/1761_1 /TAXON_ID=43686 ORGANISM="Pelagodinium beii, Strain RCC1491" /NCGR_SAMPLE_ID=MMETSP1338 /ASSEMBLY_ACC=CAM_ASM_000754 /LENGTH=206 /DNA_ID=CAMNT_0043190485 /DNA_START=212 /DNA_END=832 /DNA_ORIENTATION=+
MECPLCRGGQAVRVMKVDFDRPRRARDLSMVGFLPGEIFEAASEAFSFWASQKTIEHDWQAEAGSKLVGRRERLEQTVDERLQQATSVFNDLTHEKSALAAKLLAAQVQRDKLKAEVAAKRQGARASHSLQWSPPKAQRPFHGFPGSHVPMKTFSQGKKSLMDTAGSSAVAVKRARSTPDLSRNGRRIFSATPHLASAGRQRRRLL